MRRRKKHSSKQKCAQTKRGFTLMEVIVVLAVAALVAGIAVPAAVTAQTTLNARSCGGSREAIYTYYVMQRKLNGSARTLEETIAYYTDEAAVGSSYVKPCPDGGVFTANDAAYPTEVICSVHGAKG